ncbi:uncharacterized protein LOC106871063 isoform X1 [Octopus bimaculoides]|uniref:uncharacterized protein LOC106871063 isoform X1 n=1 Tax=Octopus bimaculoides TaxID=37653 RepID=UPI00071CFBE8|nr:uncharacterized protein LOC106871063 isoform X1 [Octopus bimaculoides]|eukprot:XP_014772815.1 PREDICTED: uncharacterized protein LOC106871063 isoform X1 [Octopus bimaculoides]
MEVYEAIADFTPDINDALRNVLTFYAGDKFVPVTCSGEDYASLADGQWVGARALKDNQIGYIPTSYIQLENTLKNINSDESKARSLPGTPADEMQHSFHSQENIFMEPHPDYLNEDIYPASDEENGLVQPKKLVNPCILSKERRDLHKELLLNHRLGKNVLKKSELQKVMQQRKEVQRRKEWDEHKIVNKRNSLELMLEERKNKITQEEEKDEKLKHVNEKLENRPEYLKVHAKIHAKVAANTKLE